MFSAKSSLGPVIFLAGIALWFVTFIAMDEGFNFVVIVSLALLATVLFFGGPFIYNRAQKNR